MDDEQSPGEPNTSTGSDSDTSVEPEPEPPLPKPRKQKGKYFCGVCSGRFSVLAHLKRHFRSHSGERPYLCQICGKDFTVKENLTVHLRSHTKEKPYICTICKRGFEHSGKLRRHEKIHSGEKPHTCSVCGKGFIQSGQLTVHFRTHSGEKPYCCVSCEKRFACSKQLKVHERTHSGERPYECPTCLKSFAHGHVLKFHMHSHSSEKQYRCTRCESVFKSRADLHAHLRVCMLVPSSTSFSRIELADIDNMSEGRRGSPLTSSASGSGGNRPTLSLPQETLPTMQSHGGGAVRTEDGRGESSSHSSSVSWSSQSPRTPPRRFSPQFFAEPAHTFLMQGNISRPGTSRQTSDIPFCTDPKVRNLVHKDLRGEPNKFHCMDESSSSGHVGFSGIPFQTGPNLRNIVPKILDVRAKPDISHYRNDCSSSGLSEPSGIPFQTGLNIRNIASEKLDIGTKLEMFDCIDCSSTGHCGSSYAVNRPYASQDPLRGMSGDCPLRMSISEPDIAASLNDHPESEHSHTDSCAEWPLVPTLPNEFLDVNLIQQMESSYAQPDMSVATHGHSDVLNYPDRLVETRQNIRYTGPFANSSSSVYNFVPRDEGKVPVLDAEAMEKQKASRGESVIKYAGPRKKK